MYFSIPKYRTRHVAGQPLRSVLSVALLACVLLIAPCPSLANEASPELQDAFVDALADYDQAQLLQEASPDRAREMFRSAAVQLSSIAEAGIVNGQLDYNIGNAYLRAGDVGRAILHYRRAERLTPRDPLLQENLKVARSRCLTPIDSSNRGNLLRSIFFWHYKTSERVRLQIGAIFFALVWIMLAIRACVRRTSLAASSAIAAVVAVACFCSVAAGRWQEQQTPSGVVVAMDVVVQKGPGKSYQRQFVQPLQPGVEFTLSEKRGGWWRITLPDGQSGWILEETADLVEPKQS